MPEPSRSSGPGPQRAPLNGERSAPSAGPFVTAARLQRLTPRLDDRVGSRRWSLKHGEPINQNSFNWGTLKRVSKAPDLPYGRALPFKEAFGMCR